MEIESRKTIKEVFLAGWKPFLAKVALLGCSIQGTLYGADWYMHPDNTTSMTHEESLPFEGDELTIMTVNVHSFQGEPQEVEGSIVEDVDVLSGLKSALRQHEPDLVCMQEVTKGDELEELYEDGYNVLHATTVRYPLREEFGNAVMSKSPLRLVDVESLPSPKTKIPRNAIMFELDLEDERVIAMTATHLGLDRSERNVQTATMMRKFGDLLQGGCGDFNSDDQEIKAGALGPLQTSSNLVLNLPTFPARNPQREIDHILLPCGQSNQLKKEAFTFGSDHKGLVETYDISSC